MKAQNLLFKKIIILFWMIWWAIALWTDIVSGLAHLGVLHASFAPDINYNSLVASLKMYHAPFWLPLLFFIGILGWSTLSTGFFIWASLGLRQDKTIWMARARTAFIISITYWLAFFLADQMVMKFDTEENHMVQGGFQLLSYLSLYLLPDE
jgi:hypothetical protein